MRVGVARSIPTTALTLAAAALAAAIAITAPAAAALTAAAAAVTLAAVVGTAFALVLTLAESGINSKTWLALGARQRSFARACAYAVLTPLLRRDYFNPAFKCHLALPQSQLVPHGLHNMLVSCTQAQCQSLYFFLQLLHRCALPRHCP